MTSKLHNALSRRKTTFETERENYEKAMSLHIQKAINKDEGPTKEKHVRTILMGTYKDQSTKLFWSISLKLPLQGHPIVCWKFLHVLHKILREGHQCSLVESAHHVVFLGELAKLWGHLKEGYGKPIHAFSKLVVAKIKFHKKYPDIQGTICLNSEIMAKITQNSIDNYFELSVDLLDYLDELLLLQNAVFASLDRSKANSMTLHGQCKLSPLIQCLQDSANIYDAIVKILFRLHSYLPPDTLTGHKERFFRSFKELQVFYTTCSNLQYYKNLVSVPLLPENPPNFLVSTDLNEHRTPIVSTVVGVPSPDENHYDDEDDKEDPSSWVPGLAAMQAPLDPSPNVVSSSLVDLENDGNPRKEIWSASFPEESASERPQNDYKNQATTLNRRNQELQAEVNFYVTAKHSADEKIKEMENRLKQLEERSEFEERYSKLKTMYQKLREEHIAVLRQNAVLNKEASALKQALDEVKKDLFERQNQQAPPQDFSIMDALSKNLDAPSQVQLNNALKRTDELKAATEALMAEKLQLAAELEFKQSMADQLTQDKFSISESLRQMEEKCHTQKAQVDALERQVQEYSESLETARGEKSQVKDLQSHLSAVKSTLLEQTCAGGIERINETLAHFDDPVLLTCRTSAEFLLGRIDDLLSDVERIESHGALYLSNESSLGALVQALNTFSTHSSEVTLHGYIVSNSAPSAEASKELQLMSRVTAEEANNFLRSFGHGWDEEALTGHCASLFSHLNGLRSLTELLVAHVADVRPEEVSDLVEAEMASIAEAVEAAEAKFRSLLHRSSEIGLTGIHLEVNMRLFESCTALMLAIKSLVQKSKMMQREIVAEGRGASSQSEFYQKHSRWTEGLISAAKAVGFGANQLCNAADRLVSNGGNHFEELIVCSQDIAASTAQLVVASRVKANPKSFSLQQLQAASSAVSEATGQVVAQARSAGEAIDDHDALDFSTLSLTQTKRLEMNSQVRLLQLESELERERARLGELRRRHYQLADTDE